MFTANRTTQQEGPDIVKVEPLVARFRLLRITMLANCAMLLFFGLMLYVINRLFGVSIIASLSLVIPILIFVSFPMSLINTRLQERFWKRLEKGRQAAARGDQNLLATEQPSPNATALQLPLTIEQRPNWFTLLLLPGTLLLVILGAVIALFAFLPQLSTMPAHRHIPPNNMFIAVTIFLILGLAMCGVVFAILYFKVRQQLTVTENGLLKLGFRKVHSVPWKEARLFAINGIFGAKKYQYPSVYELSSANEIVRWGWMRPNTWRVLFFSKPTISPEEYDKQMQALLSLIAGKTGLPLYNLR